MKIFKRIIWMVVGATVIVAQQARAQFDLIGVAGSSTNTSVFAVNRATGQGVTVGLSGVHMLNSLARNSAGLLFSVGGNAGNQLVTINPSTGAATSVATLNFGAETPSVRGLAFSSNDILYAINNAGGPGSTTDPDNLYTINLQTGIATLVGNTGLPGIQGLDFSSQGVLYGWEVGSDSTGAGLVLIDPTTGLATDVNPLIGDWEDIQSIAFAPDGTLYGVRDALYRIDVTTGAATLIGFGGYSDLRGIEAVPRQGATNSVLLWTQYYNNTNINFFGANHSDNSRAMALDESGNVIVTGWSGSPPHFCTVKYAARSGALLWEKRYQNPTNSAYPGAVAVDRHGNVIVTGSSGADFYTAKYAAADGALLWEKSYNGPENLGDSGRALAVDTNGNVIVVASIDSEKDEIGDLLSARSYVAKYAATDGALMWEAFGPTNELNVPRAVAVDSSGDLIVTGGFGSIDVYMDLVTVKYAGTNGMKLWERRYDSPTHEHDDPSAIAVDAGNNIVMTDSGGYTAKYAAADGALLWEKLHGPGANTRSLGIDRSGDVFVAGSSYNGRNYDFRTVKYAAADGTLLWDKRYDGGAELSPGLALEKNGNAIVSGQSGNPLHDIHTIKYAGADGAVLWEKHYDEGRHESGSIVAVGPDGLVVLAGKVTGGTTREDYLTIVYRETLPSLFVARGTNGVCQVSFSGAPGSTCRLERATGLNGPWETVASSPTGVIEFSDTNSPAAQVFYRVAQP